MQKSPGRVRVPPGHAKGERVSHIEVSHLFRVGLYIARTFPGNRLCWVGLPRDFVANRGAEADVTKPSPGRLGFPNHLASSSVSTTPNTRNNYRSWISGRRYETICHEDDVSQLALISLLLRYTGTTEMRGWVSPDSLMFSPNPLTGRQTKKKVPRLPNPWPNKKSRKPFCTPR
jgi:hypothetical protein